MGGWLTEARVSFVILRVSGFRQWGNKINLSAICGTCNLEGSPVANYIFNLRNYSFLQCFGPGKMRLNHGFSLGELGAESQAGAVICNPSSSRAAHLEEMPLLKYE